MYANRSSSNKTANWSLSFTPDIDNAQHSNISGHALETLMEENISTLNKELPAYSQISRLKIYYEEFEKTPKRSIKRYLYQSH